jgi:hypothetical protein
MVNPIMGTPQSPKGVFMRRRDKRIEIYFSEEELEKLDTDRAELGLSRSEYLRLLILGNVVNKKSNQEILNSILEIQKVNFNLEKINTKIEEYGEVDSFLTGVVKTSLEDLEKVIEKLNNKLD